MKTCVVYDSVYGNTAKIAYAISAAVAEALSDGLPGNVPVLPVEEVDPSELSRLDLLIIGSPTHGAMATEAVQGLLERIGAPAHEGARLATFDTRLTWKFLRSYGYAADKIADALAPRGWTLVEPQGGFFVGGLRKGPLKRGELERATAWARALVDSLD